MAKLEGLLEGTLKLVLFQFHFSNLSAIPIGLLEKEKESMDKLISRNSGIKGTEFLPSTDDVSLSQFICDLKKSGYKLVEAYYQMRPKAGGIDCPIARFEFVSEDRFREKGSPTDYRKNAEQILEKICDKNMWKTQGFLNPLFRDGGIVEGEHSISLNMAVRNPLVDKEDNPVMRWEKNEKGEKVGDRPVPLKPKKFLKIKENGDIRVENG